MGKRAHREGSIFRRKEDGRWVGALDMGVRAGKRRRKTLYGRTQEEVRVKLNQTRKAQQDGLPVAATRQRIDRFFASWLASQKTKVRQSTWERYDDLLRLHATPYIGHLYMTGLGPQHLDDLYRDRQQSGLSPATVQRLHRVISQALDQAARWGVVPRNVATLVDPPRATRHEMKTYSPEHAHTLLQAVSGDPLEALYVLALSTLARKGELRALRWSEVDLEGRVIRIIATIQETREGPVFGPPKTRKSRRPILFTKRVQEILRRHRVAQIAERFRVGEAWHDLDLVFPNKIGEPLADSSVSQNFHTRADRAGLPRIRFHDLRHTGATLLLGCGVNPKIVSEMLGHSSVAITLDLYSHVTPTMQREAVTALEGVLWGGLATDLATSAREP